MKYLVEAAWTALVEIVNDAEYTGAEVEQAAREWLADGIDLRDLIRGITVRGVAHGEPASAAIRINRNDGPIVTYEFVDDDQ